MTSLSDLRANPGPVVNEAALTVCLRPDLVAKVQQLTEKLRALPPRAAETDEASDQPRRKMGEGVDPREEAIYAELEAVVAEMAEHEGTLVLRNRRSEGEWRRWCDENPARPGPVRHPESGEVVTEGKPGWQRDLEVSGGRCNADALIDDLGTYAYSWNGELLAADDWVQALGPKVGLPDRKLAAKSVVEMYEVPKDFPQMRSALSTSLKRLSAYVSPAPSESATSDSTDGSPEPSSEASTETGTE